MGRKIGEKRALEQYPCPNDSIEANYCRSCKRSAFELGYLTAQEDLAKWATEIRDATEENFKKHPCEDLNAKIIVWNILLSKLQE